jgi:hypothetical protein
MIRWLKRKLGLLCRQPNCDGVPWCVLGRCKECHLHLGFRCGQEAKR